jgi:hypothetical protein
MLRVPYLLTLVLFLAEGCAGRAGRVPAATARIEPEAAAPAATARIRPEATVPAAPAGVAPAITPPVERPQVRWTDLYRTYLGPGTNGGCARARPCHSDTMADAGSAYAWLAQRGYIAGAQSPLVMKNSCLRWFGGNMPPRGEPNDTAARELEAWVAAGAPEN